MMLIVIDAEQAGLRDIIKERDVEVKTLNERLLALVQQNEQIKAMVSSLGLDPKQFSKSKREANCTSIDMINDPNSSTRYRRRKESEKALKFIHGGKVCQSLMYMI